MAEKRPLGLDDTVRTFLDGIRRDNPDVDGGTIEDEMVKRLTSDYKLQEAIWPDVKGTILGFVTMGGRLAAAYARGERVTWQHAAPALKVVQEVCTPPGVRGRHCQNAVFEP